MSIFGDLKAIARRSASIVAARPTIVLGRSIQAALCTCLAPLLGLGVPLAGETFLGTYGMVLGLRPDRGGRGRWLAALASGAAAPIGFLIALLMLTAIDPVSRAATTALVALAGALVGAVMAPVHLASITLVVEHRSLEDAFARVILATTGKAGSLGLMGALQGAFTFGAGLSVFLVAPWTGPWSLVLFLVVLALGSAVQTVSSIAAYETFVKAQRADFRAPRMGRVALVLAPGFVALTCALAFALAAPLPAWNQRTVPHESGESGHPSRVEAGNATGLAVSVGSAGTDSVFVSVADGGGCGVIDGFGFTEWSVSMVRTTFRGRQAFQVWRHPASGRSGQPVRVAFVDDDGVRLDDTLSDRLRRRASAWVFVPLGLAALLVALLVMLLRSASQTASLLGSEASLDAAKPGATVALTGHLRFGDGASMTRSANGRVTIEGRVRFESRGGALVVPLDEGEADIRPPGPAIEDGTPAFVIAKASELRARTHRSTALSEALLIGLGSAEDARTAFLLGESRRLVWLGIPATLSMLAAAAAMAFSA